MIWHLQYSLLDTLSHGSYMAFTVLLEPYLLVKGGDGIPVLDLVEAECERESASEILDHGKTFAGQVNSPAALLGYLLVHLRTDGQMIMSCSPASDVRH